MENKQLDWLGLIFLGFFLRNDIGLPEGFKEIYDKYSDENGNIVNQEKLIEEVQPIVDAYYNKCKEEFLKNYE